MQAGIELPASQAIDGEARWSLIKGDHTPAQTEFVAVSGGERAVLRGDWKLVVSGDARELYNLAEDPYEEIDLAARNPMVVEALQAVIDGIPQRTSINQPLFRLMLVMDRFGGEEDREPWADVVTKVP